MSLYDSLGEGGEGGGAAAPSELAAAGASKPGGPPLHRRVLDGFQSKDAFLSNRLSQGAVALVLGGLAVYWFGFAVRIPDACVTATEFTVVGSTARIDDPEDHPRWFELSEVKLFDTNGVNVAPNARVQLLMTPSNPDEVNEINDGKFWGREEGSGHFVVWQAEHKFHGKHLVKLTFDTPQEIVGAELYTTNYESFGTDAQVHAGAMSLPVRTIFLAHGTAKTGVNARGEQHCYHSHNEIRPAPCSTEDGAPPYMEPSACKIWVEPWTFQPCITADTFVVVGSTTTQCASNSASGECRFNTHPHWFELSEVKLFNDAGLDVALYADKVELLLQPSNPQDVAEINDGEFWGDKGRFVVWNEDYEPFAGQPLVRLSFNDPQSVVGAELYTTNYESFGIDAKVVAITSEGYDFTMAQNLRPKREQIRRAVASGDQWQVQQTEQELLTALTQGSARGNCENCLISGTELPVRTVFLAHGSSTSGVNAHDDEHCYHKETGQTQVLSKPCSTRDGAPPYVELAACHAATPTEAALIVATEEVCPETITPMRCTTHPVGSAGPLPCNKIQSDTQSTCITDVGAAFTGHSGTLELWSDRHYAWITAPGDIMDGEWTYVRVALETSAGAPCSHEGGFHGTLTSDSAVAVCCANHCGRTNVPTDASTVWVEHPGKWSITQHPGEPCTFYEGRVHAGPVKICCGTCWASGVFFGVADEIREIHGAGPVPCNAVQFSQAGCIDAGSAGGPFSPRAGSCIPPLECIERIGKDHPIWTNRDYSWISGPTDILSGEWTYVSSPMDGDYKPCETEGGFQGSISQPSVVAICCANHCGRGNNPTSQSTVTWAQHPGVFSITQHEGAPCTFYAAQVAAGPHKFCCESCWASGIFLATPFSQRGLNPGSVGRRMLAAEAHEPDVALAAMEARAEAAEAQAEGYRQELEAAQARLAELGAR